MNKKQRETVLGEFMIRLCGGMRRIAKQVEAEIGKEGSDEDTDQRT